MPMNKFRQIFDILFDQVEDEMNKNIDKPVVYERLARTTYSHDNSRIRTVIFVPPEIRQYVPGIADEIQFTVDKIIRAHLEPKPEPKPDPVPAPEPTPVPEANTDAKGA